MIYTKIAKKADDLIKEKVKSRGSYFIVVSSDRAVADYAWTNGSVPVRSGDFLEKMESRLRVDEGTEEDGGDIDFAGQGLAMDELMEKAFLDDEDEVEQSRKGSSRRLSKRQKAVERALEKL